MQALSGASEPDPEAVLRPARRPQQNDASCLHEEHAQVTVAPLGDAPEDGSVSGRHLLRDEADPGRKISSSCECRATADRYLNGWTALTSRTRARAKSRLSGGGACA